MTQTPTTEKKPLIRDDRAYMLPMATFLVLIWIGTLGPQGGPWGPIAYAARAIIVAAMLVLFWRSYTRIAWNHWWLGVIVGVVGIFQWVGMQALLEKHIAFFQPGDGAFNPEAYFPDQTMRLGFYAIRIFGAVLVVPVMEELFWRDFLWRTLAAPNDFKLAQVGEWDWKAFVVVTAMFATVHGHCWLTAVVWGLMIGLLLVYTRSLGACIIAHGTTNLLLAIYVLYSKQWAYW